MGEFAGWAIRSEDLTPAAVPDRTSEWGAIFDFGLSYDGYEHRGRNVGTFANRVHAARLAGGDLPADLDALRACLFFEQRRAANDGGTPEGETAEYFFELLDAIRRKVADRRA